MSSTVVVSGNPRPGSRTAQVAQRLAQELGSDEPSIIELGELTDELFVGGERVSAAEESVRNATEIVVATPSYKGSFTGLLKVFLDRFATAELGDLRAHVVAVAASGAHVASTIEHLRLVLDELGARPGTSLGLTEDRFADLDRVITEVLG